MLLELLFRFPESRGFRNLERDVGKQSRELGAEPAKGDGGWSQEGRQEGRGEAVSAPPVLSTMGWGPEQGQAGLPETAAGEEGQTIPISPSSSHSGTH